MRLASLVGPPLPLPIKVNLAPNGIPAVLGWGGWSRRVANIYEYWRERQTWWERPTARDYYQLTIEDGTPFTIFHDEQQRWFLDRQRRSAACTSNCTPTRTTPCSTVYPRPKSKSNAPPSTGCRRWP